MYYYIFIIHSFSYYSNDECCCSDLKARATQAQADAAAARDAQRRATDARRLAEQQRAAAAHAAAVRESAARRARIAERDASTPMPVGAVPISALYTAESSLVVITTDINDRSNEDKLIYINARHPLDTTR